jgi:hypothetical protein
MMKRNFALAPWALLVASACAGQDEHSAVGPCTEQQLLGYVPDDNQIESHRAVALPTINYPFGTKLNFDWGWGLTLTLRVDTSGHVVCYGKKDRFDKDIKFNSERLAAIKSLGTWRYEPFVVNGLPT